jgi:uncharacterized protein (DUF58 family)
VRGVPVRHDMQASVSMGHPATRKQEIARLVEQVCLPFRSRAWRGMAGPRWGRSQGSSVNFHDHRTYVPGDDPRHLDWAAYARTDIHTMKLFREEVSPRLDLALDVSRSMALTDAKEERSLDLFALVVSLALRDGVSLRVYLLHSAGEWRHIEAEAAANLATLPRAGFSADRAGELPLAEIPWRTGSLRLLISDLLVPQPPERGLNILGREQGVPFVLAPYLQEESEPDWRGNMELLDCETRQARQQRVEPFLLTRYRKNYQRHFESWQQEARRRSVPFARIGCESPLGEAVRRQALPVGAFEIRH